MFKIAIATCLLVAFSNAWADPLDDYIAMRVGSFSSETHARHDQRYGTAIWHIAEIWQDRSDWARWLYTESWIKDAPQPYLQRISRVVASKDGSIVITRYTIDEAQTLVGAWKTPEQFDAVDRSGLTEVDGCKTVMARTGAARFEGGTLGTTCKNSYKGASYAVSQAVLTDDGMTNWDRGFAADGTQVWGPEYGGYQFRRLDDQSNCVDPVRMLVYGTIDDRAKFMSYVGALAQSGLYVEANGYYEAMTPALEVFEGEPPPNRAVITVRFPCLEKAQAFWYSDEYADIRKIREGIADFEVLVLRVPPLPAYVRD